MKYEITNIEMYWNGYILHRIKALKDFTLINGKEIHKGDLGGWVESEDNLSQKGLCWIYDECKMYENAERSGNSIGYGYSQQSEHSRQYGDSQQYDYSRQFGNSHQYGYSQQFEHSIQFGYSHQFGNSQQFGYSWQSGNSKQFGESKADKNMNLSGNSLFETDEDIVILKSPTSGRQITIGSDRNICTGYFEGSSWWLIDERRVKLPKNHWAFSLHKQILEGKFKDIKL